MENNEKQYRTLPERVGSFLNKLSDINKWWLIIGFLLILLGNGLYLTWSGISRIRHNKYQIEQKELLKEQALKEIESLKDSLNVDNVSK